MNQELKNILNNITQYAHTKLLQGFAATFPGTAFNTGSKGLFDENDVYKGNFVDGTGSKHAFAVSNISQLAYDLENDVHTVSGNFIGIFESDSQSVSTNILKYLNVGLASLSENVVNDTSLTSHEQYAVELAKEIVDKHNSQDLVDKMYNRSFGKIDNKDSMIHRIPQTYDGAFLQDVKKEPGQIMKHINSDTLGDAIRSYDITHLKRPDNDEKK